MYVRLAFAVAAHLQHEILLVDEVLAVGDMAFQKKCLGKMGGVVKEGRTVLFVSHNMAAVGGLCTRCIYLRQGKVAEMGDTAEVISGYLQATRSKDDQPLAERSDRAGTGLVKVHGIRFLEGTSGEPMESVLTGQDICTEISYKAELSDKDDLELFNVGLGFYTPMGQLVTVFNSQQSALAFERVPSEGKVYCYIPKLGLMEGTYHVKCTLNVKGAMSDQVGDAALLTVSAGDFFGTGIAYSHHRHGVYLPHRWSLNPPSVPLGISKYKRKD